MRFETAIDERDIAELLVRFEEIAGVANDTAWSRRMDRLQAGRLESGEGALAARRCALETSWAAFREVQPWTIGMPIEVGDESVPFIQLAAMVVFSYERLTETGQRRLCGMLRDALNKEFGLASLGHEMGVACHLMHEHFDVDFNDMEGQRPGFDFLATRDRLSVEVECKLITGDIGRKVHRPLGYRLIDSLRGTAIPQFVGRLRKGLLVRLVVRGRLARRQEQQQALSSLIWEALFLGRKFLKTDAAHISVSEFDSTLAAEWVVAGELDRDGMARTLAGRLGLANKNMGVFVRGQGVIVVVVDSDEPDDVLGAIQAELLGSAKGQLSGDRPGILSCHLVDVRGDQLASLGRQDRDVTGLELMTAALFKRRPHIHSVVYTAPPDVAEQLIAMSDGHLGPSISARGFAYTISNPLHQKAGDERLSIYR